MNDSLNWESSYAIAMALREKFPATNLEDLSLDAIYKLVIELEEFNDDHEMVNDAILMSICQVWYEESTAQ